MTKRRKVEKKTMKKKKAEPKKSPAASLGPNVPDGFIPGTPAAQRAAQQLVSIEVGVYAARLLQELSLDTVSRDKAHPKPVDKVLDELLDAGFLLDFLLNHVNPSQLEQAETYENRVELCIALMKALRGENGYSVETKFGPFIVYIPASEQKRIEAEGAEPKGKGDLGGF